MAEKLESQDRKPGDRAPKCITRRDFLRMTGAVALGAVLAETIPEIIWCDKGLAAIPVSGGYLLVDTEMCSGCCSCMAACSVAHEGEVSMSLARIQIQKNPHGVFPDDLGQKQCRQCVAPKCLEACPTGALHVDAEHLNVRTVDEEKCIGCQSCLRACPFQPVRAQFDPDGGHAQKCDLCTNAPYWTGEGPACVMSCPMKAIRFSKELPVQEGDAGYEVDLKPPTWGPKYWAKQW